MHDVLSVRPTRDSLSAPEWYPRGSGGTLGLNLGGALIGVGIAGTGLGVVMGTVSRAVPAERRSQTVGCVAAAGSLGTFVLAPLGQWLIDGAGWRSALLAFALVAGSMALLGAAIRPISSGGATAVHRLASALAVVEPFTSGMGGGGFFLLHRAADGLEVMVAEPAPLATSP